MGSTWFNSPFWHPQSSFSLSHFIPVVVAAVVRTKLVHVHFFCAVEFFKTIIMLSVSGERAAATESLFRVGTGRSVEKHEHASSKRTRQQQSKTKIIIQHARIEVVYISQSVKSTVNNLNGSAKPDSQAAVHCTWTNIRSGSSFTHRTFACACVCIYLVMCVLCFFSLLSFHSVLLSFSDCRSVVSSSRFAWCIF